MLMLCMFSAIFSSSIGYATIPSYSIGLADILFWVAFTWIAVTVKEYIERSN